MHACMHAQGQAGRQQAGRHSPAGVAEDRHALLGLLNLADGRVHHEGATQLGNLLQCVKPKRIQACSLWSPAGAGPAGPQVSIDLLLGTMRSPGTVRPSAHLGQMVDKLTGSPPEQVPLRLLSLRGRLHLASDVQHGDPAGADAAKGAAPQRLNRRQQVPRKLVIAALLQPADNGTAMHTHTCQPSMCAHSAQENSATPAAGGTGPASVTAVVALLWQQHAPGLESDGIQLRRIGRLPRLLHIHNIDCRSNSECRHSGVPLLWEAASLAAVQAGLQHGPSRPQDRTAPAPAGQALLLSGAPGDACTCVQLQPCNSLMSFSRPTRRAYSPSEARCSAENPASSASGTGRPMSTAEETMMGVSLTYRRVWPCPAGGPWRAVAA